MAVFNWSSLQRSFTPRDCADVRPFEATINTDLVTLVRSATPVPIKSWSGPPTDRAHLLVRQIQAADFPVEIRFELGVAVGDLTEPWVRLSGGRTLLTPLDASGWAPLGATGGVLAPRWTLSAWLDPASAVAEVKCVLELLVDRGLAASPLFSVLATGVVP